MILRTQMLLERCRQAVSSSQLIIGQQTEPPFYDKPTAHRSYHRQAHRRLEGPYRPRPTIQLDQRFSILPLREWGSRGGQRSLFADDIARRAGDDI